MVVNEKFSTAESLKNSGKYQDAIKAYQEVVAIGGTCEKAYWSQFMIGVIKEGTGQPIERFIYDYIRCSEIDDKRAEHFLHIIIALQKNGLYRLSHLYSSMAMKFHGKNPKPLRTFNIDDSTYSNKLYDCHKLNCQTLKLTDSEYLQYNLDEKVEENKALQYNKAYEELFVNTLQHEQFYPQAKISENRKIEHSSEQAIKIRFLTLGDFGKISLGGIYNPSISKIEDGYCGLVRVESNYFAYDGLKFASPSLACYCEFDNKFNTTHIKFLKQIGYNIPTRIEDFRTFVYRGKLYASHSGIEMGENNVEFKQYLSIVNLKDGTLEKIKKFEPLYNKNEKNWSWFVKGDELFILYSINPFIIYKYDIDSDSLVLYTQHKFSGKWNCNGYLAISTFPIEYDNQYLVFIHSRIDGFKYVQGALIFDKETFKPLYFTKDYFISGGNEEGKNRGVLYISSAVLNENELMLFYGEADSHSSALKIGKIDFDKIIYSQPI